MSWVLCKDVMPPADKRVLCVSKRFGLKILSLDQFTCEYRKEKDWRGESVRCVIQRFSLDDVTHWMPLPAMPEEVAE